MADFSMLTAVELAANTQTVLPTGGVSVGSAGTYSLNICNDSDSDIAFEAIFVTAGSVPGAAHKIRPAFTLEAKGWRVIQPISLGEGFKVFVTASAPCAVQLIGKKEG